MSISKNLLCIIFCFFFVVFFNEAMAQEQTLKYQIRVLGMDVGELTVTERVEGQDTIIEAISDVKVRIIFTYRVKYIQRSVHRSGELLQSSLLTYKKDELNSSTELIKTGDEYMLIKDGDTSFVHGHIQYSGSLLYFHEPANEKYMYFEISGEKAAVESTGAHAYRIIRPDNGRESDFEYSNGILQRSAIEHRIATIYTERLPD
ncbi:MAG: DUF6134 family protein [Bacteroidota bacterium]